MLTEREDRRRGWCFKRSERFSWNRPPQRTTCPRAATLPVCSRNAHPSVATTSKCPTFKSWATPAAVKSEPSSDAAPEDGITVLAAPAVPFHPSVNLYVVE
uniref:(northern house mosquito) hypothetical protein n=1 Tax=Culex pipiens TaxID=7175 RepID=A0A8D8D1Z8_CULPI